MSSLPKKTESSYMIIALVGNNTFFLRQKLNSLIAEFIDEHGQLAVERIDASEVEPDRILDAVQAVAFLSPRKMVVVSSLSSAKSAAETLEQIIDSDNDETTIIIYDPLTDKRTSYFKTLKSKTSIVEMNEIEAANLPQWLVDEAKKMGASLSRADAAYMVERLGANQSTLYSELEKISIGQPKIDRTAIDENTERTPQSKIFDLIDSIFSGNSKQALKLYAEQRAQKVEPQAILAMITWQLNLVAIAQSAGRRAQTEVASNFGISPYPLQKAGNLASKTSVIQLQKAIRDASQLDYESKTISIDLDEALQAYIVSL
jgi:DNA polymerase-3 subunit delta